MRVLRLFLITAVLCAVSGLLFSLGSAFAVENELTLSFDNGGVYISSYSGDSASVLELTPESLNCDYRLRNKILAMTVYNSSAYFVCHSPSQKDVCILTRACDGKIKDELYFRGFSHRSKTCLAVDDKYFYLINSNGRADVFNFKGEKVYTTSSIVNDMVSCGDKVFCNSNNTTFYLRGNRESSIQCPAVKGKLRFCDGDFALDSKGYAYFLSVSGVGCMKMSDSFGKICGLNGELFVLKGSSLTRYSSDGKSTGETALNSYPDYLAAYKNKLVFVYRNGSGYSLDEEKPDALFGKTKTESSHANTKKAEIKGYKSDNEYIYINEPMTIAAFKKSVAETYKCDFYTKKSGKIGTGLKVKLYNNSTQKNCTFVLYGDVTGEGNINSNDKRAMFRHLLKVEFLGGVYRKAADMNKDNSVTNADLVLVSRQCS